MNTATMAARRGLGLPWTVGVLVFLCAAAAAKPPVMRARIDISGVEDGIRVYIVRGPKGGSGRPANWRSPEENKQYATFEMPADPQRWQEMTVGFMPDKSGTVRLELKGMWYQLDEAVQRIWIVYDDVSAKNATVRNGGFEEARDGGPAYWHLREKDGFRALRVTDPKHVRNGSAALEVTHDQAAVQVLEVRANTIVTITAWQRLSSNQ